MMKMKTLILAISALIGYMAKASPTHLFYCAITNTEPMTQVYFEIEDSDIKTGHGKVIISKLSHNAELNTGWQIQQQAQVKMEIKWGSTKYYNNKSIITEVYTDMGRSGIISAKMIGLDDTIENSRGFVQSTLMSLNAPNGIDAEYCYYFLSLGPKPGMTGSN